MSIAEKLVKGINLQNQGDLTAAAALFQEVIALDSSNAHALYSMGLLRMQSGDLQGAHAFTSQGVTAQPGFGPMWFLHGTVLQSQGKHQAALDSFDQALAVQPDYVEVLLNSGALLRGLFRHHEALERFNKILSIEPDHTAALANCGILLTEFKQSADAIRMFERLISLAPDYPFGLGLLFFERMHICDWNGYADLRARIIDGVRAGKAVCKSLAFMAASDQAKDHQKSAEIFSKSYCPPSPNIYWSGKRYKHKKIRLAYVSPDFREHPVGHLMAGVFEQHDKSRFEIIAISMGIDDQSRLRGRMLKAFDQFIDIRDMGTQRVAELMHEMEIDIAVDLGGFTSDTRTTIFSHRPAPVQVNYLGYPGTMGCEYYDYILADRHVIPPEQQDAYSEKVVYLPDSYLPTDNSVRIADRTPSRAECGLPADAFVFCSFSHDYKLCPPVFDVWMRLLQQVSGSVLWLASKSEAAKNNLRNEARARGVDPERLIFAGRVPLVEDHLARYRQADLFLDTHPYNAHTTAADALMAGLPVVTYMGESFPSRVAGSLLDAAGLPDLVTHSLAEYEALSLALALDPAKLEGYRKHLQAEGKPIALLDTADFCRHLEAAYIAMWRKTQIGPFQDELS